MTPPLLQPPTAHDIEMALARIRSEAVRTPLLESSLLNQMAGGRILIKAEPLQRSGSFKFRGAFNTLSQLTEAQKKNGVIAYSSGNHAQGVALAAQVLGVQATILMPEDAPQIKVSNTKAYGAEVLHFNRYKESREEIGQKLCQERGATLIKPYDDPRIIAGQGTAGLEIVEQVKEIGGELDQLIAPCGGGGLISGLSLAVTSRVPDVKIYCAEPEGYDDTLLSLKAGKIVGVDPNQKSICDALMAPQPGDLTFQVNSKLLSGGYVVSEEEVRQAIRAAFNTLKLVVEPGGAVALASVLSGKGNVQGKTTVVVCSGGNIDASLFAEILKT